MVPRKVTVRADLASSDSSEDESGSTTESVNGEESEDSGTESDGDNVSQLERKRQENIAKKKALFDQLGFADLKAKRAAEHKAKKRAAKQKRREPKQASVPSRLSARQRGIEAPLPPPSPEAPAAKIVRAAVQRPQRTVAPVGRADSKIPVRFEVATVPHLNALGTCAAPYPKRPASRALAEEEDAEDEEGVEVEEQGSSDKNSAENSAEKTSKKSGGAAAAAAGAEKEEQAAESGPKPLRLESSQRTTCHWCRHRERPQKSICSDCTRPFCANCLRSRFGENAFELTEGWKCPVCRDICNCSRKECLRGQRGLPPTGELNARSRGFPSAAHLLILGHFDDMVLALARGGKDTATLSTLLEVCREMNLDAELTAPSFSQTGLPTEARIFAGETLFENGSSAEEVVGRLRQLRDEAEAAVAAGGGDGTDVKHDIAAAGAVAAGGSGGDAATDLAAGSDGGSGGGGGDTVEPGKRAAEDDGDVPAAKKRQQEKQGESCGVSDMKEAAMMAAAGPLRASEEGKNLARGSQAGIDAAQRV